MSQALSHLTRSVRAAQDQALHERARPPVEERLARVHAELGRRDVARRRSPLVAVGAGLAVAACVALWWSLRPPAPLTAVAGSQPVALEQWLSSGGEAHEVRFSDGSTVTLAPQSAARLLHLDAEGATVALERGTLHAAVVHRERARWLVAAGPFEVRVTGTTFEASYDPIREQLEVRMFEGSVSVSGACLTSPRALAGSQAATFRCGPELAMPAPAAALPEPPSATPSAPAVSAAAVRAPAAAPTPAEKPPGWMELARDGRFKLALAAAEAEGFSALCLREGGDALLELGNVARLAGNPARAAEAYQALRQRFAGSAGASAAAFQLGRLAFDGAGNYDAARRWFAAYLSEQPGGAFAQEALGRTLEAEHRLGLREQATQTAAQYLARHPGGAHAALARSLVGE